MGDKTKFQVAMLDVATGQLKNNYLLTAALDNEPRVQMICRPGKDYQSDQDDQSENEDNEDQRIELLIGHQRYSIPLIDPDEAAEVIGPAVLSHEASVMKLEDDLEKVAEDEAANLVIDLEPMAQQAKEANEAMLELGKFEAELFEKQRKARQQQQ